MSRDPHLRERLPNRHASMSFDLEVAGQHYTTTVSQFHDGRIGGLFLNNHKSNSQADTNAAELLFRSLPNTALIHTQSDLAAAPPVRSVLRSMFCSEMNLRSAA
jgi:hypothetical protein